MKLFSAQLKKNTIWSLSELGLYPIVMIISTPVFIHQLGMEQYGIWMMASTLSQFMYLFNFGLSESVILGVSSHKALNQTDKIIKIIGVSWTQGLFLALMVTIISALMVASGVIQHWFHVPDLYAKSSAYILFMAMFSMAVKFCEMVLLGILKGFERFDLAARLTMLSKNSAILIALIIVLLKGNLAEMFAGMVILNLINVGIQVWVLKRHYPFIKLKPVKFQWRKNSLQFWYWIQSSAGLLGFLSDRFIVGYLTNLSTLGAYSIATLIGSQIHNALISLGTFTFPRVAHIKSEQQSALPVFIKASVLIHLGGWLIIMFLLVAGGPMFSLWLGAEKYQLSASYIQLYLVFVAIHTVTIIPFQINNASGKPVFNALFEIGLRLAHVAAMFVGLYFAGVNGLITGICLVTLLFIGPAYYYFSLYYFKNIKETFFLLLPCLSFIPFLAGNGFLISALALGIFSLTVYFAYRKHLKQIFWK